MRKSLLLPAAFLSTCCLAQNQTKTDAEIKAEAAKASDLSQRQDFVAALPLYEDLHRQQPASLIWDERLAMALLGSDGAATPGQRAENRQRARKLLREAQAGGDNSGLLQVLLEKTADVDAPAQPQGPQPVGHEFFAQAESAFSHGDLPGAVALYGKAFAANPQYYAAATFAGDAEYKQQHYDAASQWFAKAVAIDPNQETAWRYWGDCLEKAGHPKEAEEKFIQAVIAQPYQRSPRVGLKQWADANHALLAPPPIKIPARASVGTNGGMQILVDPNSLKDPSGALWIVYPTLTQSWQQTKFAQHFPNEKAYRHSLLEEADSLRMVLAVAHKEKLDFGALPDPTLRALDELDRNGMLECFILLDHADQGIAQDYAAFRAQHRDLLAAYIARYDVHPTQPM